MKRGVIILLALPVASYALCPSGLKVEVTNSSLHAEFSTDTPGRTTRARLRYGDTVAMPRESIPKLANDAAARSRVVNVTDLRAGLPKLYFDPQVSDPKETQWSGYASCQAQLCPSSGPQPGGYACEADGAGALIPYVSVPPDSTEREPPELPRHIRVNPRERPAINGKITKLSDCSAVQQALDDHGAGGTKDPNLNHEIRLPPGAICRPEQESSRAGKNLGNYTLPAKTGAGVTIITCDWAPLEGPPPGVQYAPDLRTDRSCGFGLNRRTVRDGSAFQAAGGLFTTAKCPAPPCTRGWRFETLVFEAGDWRELSTRKVPVRSVDVANGRITLAEPIGDLYASNVEMVLNLPGIRTMVPGQGKRHADFNQRGCMAAKLSGTELACSGVERMTGEYKGGGYVTAAQGYPIESCAAEEKTVTCTLSDAHGLGDFHAFQVASLQDGVLEIAEAGHGWTKGAAVLIQGNSACDGIYNVHAAPNPRSAKLAGGPCSGTGGTVRRLYTGRFFDLEGAGAAALEGVHLVDFPAPNQVRAFDVPPGAAVIEGGGFVYTNPKVYNFFAMRDAAGVTWDRVLFDLGAPFRVFNLIGIGNDQVPGLACDCAILDSCVDGLHFWQPVTPGAGFVDSAQIYSPFSAIPVMVRGHVVKDLHLDGVTLANSAAFAFFADQSRAPGPSDVTFRRVSMTLPDELVGGPHSKGLAYNLRHFIEVKGGLRLLFEGVQVQNWASVGIAGAAPIFFSYRTNNPSQLRLMQDLTLRNIFMRNVPVGIAFRSGVEGYALHEPIRRVLIDNWLLDGIDNPNRQGAPHEQALNLPGTFYEAPVGAGSALALGGPAEDVRITRVTARRLLTKHVPNFLWLQDNRGNGLQIDRSIISYSPAGIERGGVSVYAHTTRRLVPQVVGIGSKAFLSWTDRMGSPDTRSWFGAPDAPVGIIPCLTNSNTLQPDFEAPNNARSLAARAFACEGKNCAGWNVLIAGKDRQSCAERESQVLDQDLNGIGPFEGLGADARELARALGYFPAEIRDVTSTGADLVYRPLDSRHCVVDHSRDSGFKTFVRSKDDGGEGDRTMPLNGYRAGETVYYRLLCPQSVPISASFKTK